MGMSASQARLIALTARMSDTEYEAQQINQQRLTISNQMNAVYAAMCDMEVPTPPSKLDFKKKVYTGKVGDTQYTVKPDGNGSLKAYQKKQGATLQKSASRSKVENSGGPGAFVKENSHAIEDFKHIEPSDYEEVVKNQKVGADGKAWDGFGNSKDDVYNGVVKLTYERRLSAEEASALPENAGKDPDDISYVSVKSEVAAVDLKNANDLSSVTAKISEIMQRNDFVEGDNGIQADYSNVTASGSIPVGADGIQSGKTYVGADGKSVTGDSLLKHNAAADELCNEDFAVRNADGTYSKVKGSDIRDGKYTNALEITDKGKFNSALETGGKVTVGGFNVMSISDAKAAYESDPNASKAWEFAYEALKHRYSGSEEGQPSPEDFSVIVAQDKDGNYSFSFCETADIENDAKGKGDGYTYVFSPVTGTYDEEVEGFDPSSVTYDTTGNAITGANINGDDVSLGTETEFDEDGYELAMQKYNNEKAVYDQEQNELNKQTSIYQRQDKMLEMKLTRLDNERNALNTEIEAVKKVIQDAIDRGFKTFSG